MNDERPEPIGDPFKARPLKVRNPGEQREIELSIVAYPSDRSNPARLLTGRLVLLGNGGWDIVLDESDTKQDFSEPLKPDWFLLLTHLLSRK